MLIYDVLHKETIYQSIVSDLRNFGVKYRFKKSTFKSERQDSIKKISKNVFKTPLSYQPLDVVNLFSGGIVHVPVFLSQATAFLEKHISQEGLFRKAGSQLRQKELIARLDNGGVLGEKHHAIDVANCLKSFFRELPEPLIPYRYHDLFVHCAMLKACHVEAVLLACILLPPHNLNTLAFFMEFLNKVSFHEKQNKMNIDNLAKVVGPNIMPLQEATMSAVQMRLELHLAVVKILIENAGSIGVLPDHITQAISMETIGSTDNELEVSECQSRSKSRKKKHRSGSLTRMFNGLKKIVGKGGVLEENNITENQQIPLINAPLSASNAKATKKRKVVERLDPPSTKKKRVVEKMDKSKKLRLSLDRFVPKNKPELHDGDSKTFDSYTERRWSSVSDSYDPQRKCRTCSNGSSQVQLFVKDNKASNTDLQQQYDDVFIDADVNLSDDSDEQVLLAKKDSRCHKRLCSASKELKTLADFEQLRLYTPKKRMSLNNVETHSRNNAPSIDDQSEEYVTIPKSEYEEIKNRVSAIESRLSQELGCVDNQENVSLSAHSVNKVQTEYEKTLEESSIESTASTDYLAKKLGKELKIRRSAEHKIIRSPSARKIGSLRRRSQEKIMSSKRIRRTASWHIPHGLDLRPETQFNQELNNARSINGQISFSSNYVKTDSYLQPGSTLLCDEEKRNVETNKQRNSSDIRTAKLDKTNYNLNSIRIETVQPSKNRAHTSVRRVSSFHGNEFINTTMYFDEKVEKLRKTNSQQNIILNDTRLTKSNSKSDCWKKTVVSWKDADGYFTTANHVITPIPQTRRASIAKLRTQNAGMVLAKAKLFEECTSKICTQQGNDPHKKDEWVSANDRCTSALKHKEVRKQSLKLSEQNSKRSDLPCRKTTNSTKNRSEVDHQETKTNFSCTSRNSNLQDSKTRQIVKDRLINNVTNVTSRQKENVGTKTPPLVKTVPANTISHDSRFNVYKSESNTCKTPHIKKPLTVKTPKSAKGLVRKSAIDSRRTPLKAVSQLGTPKYQSPKSILKTKNLSRYA